MLFKHSCIAPMQYPRRCTLKSSMKEQVRLKISLENSTGTSRVFKESSSWLHGAGAASKKLLPHSVGVWFLAGTK